MAFLSFIINLFKKSTYGYKEYIRPDDGYSDNMNYKLFQCSGIFKETNRKRTITLESFEDGNDIPNQLFKLGYIEPFDIQRVQFPEVTECQRKYIPFRYKNAKLCKYDAQAILSREFDGGSISNPDLLIYATTKKIQLSYYTKKEDLYNMIFNYLESCDKIFFFVFCVYRYTTDDRIGNPDASPYRNLFYDFACSHADDEKFCKSMNKYYGEELRYFGKLYVDGTELHGGSTNTFAYKETIAFLKQHFELKNINSKRLY